MHADRMLLMAVMKSSLSGPFLLLFLLSSNTVSGLGSVVSKYYSYIQNHYTWLEAQSYCRSYHNDLATIYKKSDADSMNLVGYHAWIGLHRQPEIFWRNNWIWSDGKDYNFSAWANYEPHYTEDCANIYYNNQRAYGAGCDGYRFFICHKKQGPNYRDEFVPLSKKWTEAQQYCRNNYVDLAGYTNSELSSAVGQQYTFPVWIGLHRDGGTWKWSSGLSDYTDWASGEPQTNGDCVSIYSLSKAMATQDCSARFPFVCFRDNLVLVKENKTWEEALEHCRGLTQSNLRYELVSVQPGDDYDYVMNRVMEADTEEVWAGLRFLAGYWLWVNGADMLYSDLPLCPPEMKHCGALSKNDTGSVEIRDCLERKHFLCYSTY